MLLSGPPGLGKTTPGGLIARRWAPAIQSTTGPRSERAGDLAAMSSGLAEGDVLFIDEVHRMSTAAEE